MDILAPLIVIVVLTVVVLLVSAPLRGGASARAEERDEVLRADLDAAREAKYREIRDAELDYRMGKLSQADWRRLDRELRAEAIEILKRLDALGPGPAGDIPAAEPRRARRRAASTAKEKPAAPAAKKKAAPRATPKVSRRAARRRAR